jgi:hypothetical protein
MNPWHVFLEYAKSHPQDVPKTQKERAKVYQNMKQSCFCGQKDKLCGPLGFAPKVKIQDMKQTLLQAKVKAYEDIIEDNKLYIAKLEKLIRRSKVKAATH